MGPHLLRGPMGPHLRGHRHCLHLHLALHQSFHLYHCLLLITLAYTSSFTFADTLTYTKTIAFTYTYTSALAFTYTSNRAEC